MVEDPARRGETGLLVASQRGSRDFAAILWILRDDPQAAGDVVFGQTQEAGCGLAVHRHLGAVEDVGEQALPTGPGRLYNESAREEGA